MAQPLVSLRAIILLLACASGCVEAVLYLGLGVVTAAITGHTVLLGIAIAHANVVAIMRLIPALLGYLTGVAIGGVVIAIGVVTMWGGLPYLRGPARIQGGQVDQGH